MGNGPDMFNTGSFLKDFNNLHKTMKDVQEQQGLNTGYDKLKDPEIISRTFTSATAGIHGPHAQQKLDDSSSLAQDLAEMQKIMQESNRTPQETSLGMEAYRSALGKFEKQAADGMSTLLSDIMYSSGFHPWALTPPPAPGSTAGQDTSPGMKQLMAFQTFLTHVQSWSMLFKPAASDVRIIRKESSDFGVLIDTVSDVMSEAVKLAAMAGESAATENPTGAGAMATEGEKLIQGIKNMVNAASSRDHYEQTSALCTTNVINVDDNAQYPLTWTAIYQYLFLEKDRSHCKTTRQEALIFAYASFSFDVGQWPNYAEQLAQKNMSTFKSLLNGIQTPPDTSNTTYQTPVFNAQVGPYKKVTY